MTWAEQKASESPTAKAKGTVRPSDIPMMISRTSSPPVKWGFGVWSQRWAKWIYMRSAPFPNEHLNESDAQESSLLDPRITTEIGFALESML